MLDPKTGYFYPIQQELQLRIPNNQYQNIDLPPQTNVAQSQEKDQILDSNQNQEPSTSQADLSTYHEVPIIFYTSLDGENETMHTVTIKVQTPHSIEIGDPTKVTKLV